MIVVVGRRPHQKQWCSCRRHPRRRRRRRQQWQCSRRRHSLLYLISTYVDCYVILGNPPDLRLSLLQAMYSIFRHLSISIPRYLSHSLSLSYRSLDRHRSDSPATCRQQCLLCNINMNMDMWHPPPGRRPPLSLSLSRPVSLSNRPCSPFAYFMLIVDLSLLSPKLHSGPLILAVKRWVRVEVEFLEWQMID